MADQIVGLEVQAVASIGTVPGRRMTGPRDAEVIFHRNFVMFNPVVDAVVYDKIQLANGAAVGLDLLVFQEDFPAEEVLQQHLVQALEIKSQPALGWLPEQSRRSLQIAIPCAEFFQMIEWQVAGGLK